MKYNERVCLDLNISLEHDYVLSKIEDMQNTNSIKDGDKGTFNFNLSELFIKCPMVFKQVSNLEDKDEIKKVYDTNKKKFNKMLKEGLGKALIRETVKRDKLGKKESYFKFNKSTMTILKNGYPVKQIREFTEIEKIVMRELKIDILSNSISKQLENMDINVLNDSISVAKENGILDYAYVRAIYNNLIQADISDNKKVATTGNSNNSYKNTTNSNRNINNIVPENKNNINNNYAAKLNPKVHNYMGSANFMKYTEEELEKMILENQKDKFK